VKPSKTQLATPACDRPGAKRIDDADCRYIEAVKGSASLVLDLSGLKIVIDWRPTALRQGAPTSCGSSARRSSACRTPMASLNRQLRLRPIPRFCRARRDAPIPTSHRARRRRPTGSVAGLQQCFDRRRPSEATISDQWMGDGRLGPASAWLATVMSISASSAYLGRAQAQAGARASGRPATSSSALRATATI